MSLPTFPQVLDLEDRQRRNNTRIRGISESVTPDLLRPYLTHLMASVLPTCSSLNLTIDRIHRIPKPKNLLTHSPRDTIAQIHFFHIKDEFLSSLRRNTEIPERFKSLSIFLDLSAAAMLKRREYAAFTKILRDNNIQYWWGFPVKLIVHKDGNSMIYQDPLTIKAALQSWNLLSTPNNSPPRKRPTKPPAITPLWSEKQSRSRTVPAEGPFLFKTHLNHGPMPGPMLPPYFFGVQP